MVLVVLVIGVDLIGFVEFTIAFSSILLSKFIFSILYKAEHPVFFWADAVNDH